MPASDNYTPEELEILTLFGKKFFSRAEDRQHWRHCVDLGIELMNADILGEVKMRIDDNGFTTPEEYRQAIVELAKKKTGFYKVKRERTY